MPPPTQPTATDVHDWSLELHAVGRRLAGHFPRSEPRRRAVEYLRGLLSDAGRKNGWQLADRPPSSDSPSFQYKPAPPRRPSSKAPGGRPGHHRNQRVRLQPDHILEMKPRHRRRCGEALQGDDPESLIHQIVEIPKVRLHLMGAGRMGKRVVSRTMMDLFGLPISPAMDRISERCYLHTGE